MKIKQIEIENVKGIPNGIYDLSSKIYVFAGENGSGKTTILNILTSILSGTRMPDNWIKKGEKKGIFTMTLDSGDVIELSKTAKSALVAKLNQQKTTLDKINEYIKTHCYLTDNDEIIKYAEVLDNMKPKDFTRLVMSKIPVEIKKTDIKKYMSDYKGKTWKTDEMVEFTQAQKDAAYENLASKLPDSFDKAALSVLKDNYKELIAVEKKNIEKYTEKVMSFMAMSYPAARDVETIQKDIAALNGQKHNIKLIQLAWTQYEAAVKQKAEYEAFLVKKAEEITAMKVAQPNENALAEQEALLKQWNEYQMTLTTTLSNTRNTYNMLQKNIEALDTPVCPLSGKLVCTTDKTPLKAELEGQMKQLEQNIANYEAALKETSSKIAIVQQNLTVYRTNTVNWNKYVAEVNAYNELVKNMPADPEKIKPQQQPMIDTDIEKALIALTNENNIAMLTLQHTENLNQLLQAKTNYHMYNYLIQQLEDNGSIMEKITQKYIKALNKLVDMNLQNSFSNWKFTFAFDDGIIPTVSIDDKPYVAYALLSSGEQAIMALFITDLLNSIMYGTIETAAGTVPTGPRTLLIDGLEKLDAPNFKKFMAALTETDIANRYDNILINLVNHTDLLQELNSSVTVYVLKK